MLERNNVITRIVARTRHFVNWIAPTLPQNGSASARKIRMAAARRFAATLSSRVTPAIADMQLIQPLLSGGLAKLGNGGPGRFGISVAFWAKGLWDRLWVYTQWRY
jgi:hypothetical protein